MESMVLKRVPVLMEQAGIGDSPAVVPVQAGINESLVRVQPLSTCGVSRLCQSQARPHSVVSSVHYVDSLFLYSLKGQVLG